PPPAAPEPGLRGVHRGPAHVHGGARRRRARGAARHERRARRIPRDGDARRILEARRSATDYSDLMKCALLHGFAGDPACWDDVIANCQLPEPPVTVALPGHGGGLVQATWEQNLEHIARRVADCDAVVGYSLGARVGLGLVASGYIGFGVLIGCNPGIAEAEREARRAFDESWMRILRDDGIAVFIDAWEAQPLFATQARVPRATRDARRTRR